MRIQVLPGIPGGDTTAAVIAAQLERQAREASSPLLAGTITRHTTSLSVASPQVPLWTFWIRPECRRNRDDLVLFLPV